MKRDMSDVRSVTEVKNPQAKGQTHTSPSEKTKEEI